MQIVIDIPESKIKDPSSIDLFYMVGAIKNGTPLPKGHGRLIDADAFRRKICTYRQTGCGSCKYSLCCTEDEPTIIEADKESD